ncbi:MAG: hypothetical protein QOD02_5756, partial [Mycobacterium sp.]|nr:hypothetical protein [Mycobacterium sp.]
MGYRQDFATIAFLVTDGNLNGSRLTRRTLRCGRAADPRRPSPTMSSAFKATDGAKCRPRKYAVLVG